MSGEPPVGDLVVVAGAAAATGGALAVFAPYFRGLTEAAAALALVAWLPRWSRRTRPAGTPMPSARVLGGLGTMGLAGALFLGLPAPLDRIGALCLGASALALGAWVPATTDPEPP